MQPVLTKGQTLLDKILIAFATGGYSGFAGTAPGTVGSLVGLLLYLPLASSPALVPVAAAVTVFFLGVFASSHVASIWRIKDPQAIVIDEIVGMWIALLLVPFEIVYVAGAFVAFRIFDIVKPFPARQAERLSDGWGIMLDDVVAGIYANLTVRCFVYLRWLLGS